DHVRFALAESYLSLKKPDQAVKIYKDVEENPVDKNYAIEAAFRIGDVQFKEHKYGEALKIYKAALSKHSQFKTVFPNAAYNVSEAQFWLGEYVNSLDGFIDFLKMFPYHQYGGFAL